MKFLVDAQLPVSLIALLRERGLEALHTSQLPEGNATTDTDLLIVADRDNRIVVTKDQDFVDSYYVKSSPRYLLHITTGNISNQQLLQIFRTHLDLMLELFIEHHYLELSRQALIVHQ